MAPPEPSDPTAIRPECSNAAETQEDNLKNNLMKIIEVLKEGIKNSFKEIKEMQTKIWKKSINPLTKVKK